MAKSAPLGTLKLEVFLDTDPSTRTARYVYVPGVVRTEILLDRAVRDCRRHTAQLLHIGRPPSDISWWCHQDRGHMQVTVFIPWAACENFTAHPGALVAIASRISCPGTPPTIVAGTADLDPGNAGPETDPETFDLYSLSERSASVSSLCDAWEVLDGMHPELLIRYIEGTHHDTSVPLLAYAVSGIGKGTALLVPSVSGEFRWAIIRLPIAGNPGKDVRVRVTRGGLVVLDTVVRLRASRLLQSYLVRLHEITDHLSTKRPLVVALFEQLGAEIARRAQLYSDGIRPVQRAWREANDLPSLEREESELLGYARATFDETHGANSLPFVVSAWESEAGTIYPLIGYRAKLGGKGKPPLTILFHGYNRYLTRVAFLFKVLRRDPTITDTDDERSAFVSTYGAGNNYLGIGPEELAAAFKFADNELGADIRKTTFRGHSNGGTMALYYAERMPTGVLRVDARSAIPIFPTLQEFRIYGPNLCGVGIRLAAGERDFPTLGENRRGFQAFKQMGANVRLDIVPNQGHNFALPSLAPDELAPLAKDDSVHVFATDDPRFDEAYGIRIVAPAHNISIASPASFVIKCKGKTVRLLTTNIDTLELTPEFDARAGTTSVELDGTDLTAELASNLREYRKAPPEDGRKPLTPARWVSKMSAASPGWLPSSADGYLRRRFIIVYGTRESTLAPLLRERAEWLRSSLCGTKAGQWSGRQIEVVSDEVAADRLVGQNAYLIGTSGENAVVQRLYRDRADRLLAVANAALPNADAVNVRSILQPPNDADVDVIDESSSPMAYAGDRSAPFVTIGTVTAWHNGTVSNLLLPESPSR